MQPFMWEMFEHFPKVVAKTRGEIGDLLDTINHFMLYGKNEFAQREGAINVYAQILEKAMFTHKIIPDCEGAITCQLLFQSLAGTASLDTVFAPLLDMAKRRLSEDPVSIELKKHLLGIFMSAMYYNSTLALQYLESN